MVTRLPSVICCAGLIVLVCACAASAALGGNERSIQEEVARMHASWQVQRKEGYAVHEIRLPSGTVVREYVSGSGKVVAVSWHGPFLPDLQQLLGKYFERYKQAAVAAHRRGRRPLVVRQPELVVQSGGHMRAFHGKAYLPNMLPDGLHADAIR